MGSSASKQVARKLPKYVKNDINLTQTDIKASKMDQNDINSIKNIDQDQIDSKADPQIFAQRLKDIGQVEFKELKTDYIKENSMLDTVKRQQELFESEKKLESNGQKLFLSPDQIRQWLEVRGTSDEESVLKQLNINESVINDLKVLELPNNLAKEDESGRVFIGSEKKGSENQ